MALDTYDSIVNSLLLRCPMAGGQLAEQFINYAFRDLIEKRKWSWTIAQSQFIFPAVYNTGTATLINQSNQVTGAGTAWTTAMIGYQFRTSTLTPIYTISAVNVGTQTITLDQPWGAASSANSGYQIYIAYQIPPTDFHAFVSIWDPNFSWSLWSTVSQAELNTYDAQRASQGTPYVVADFDYTALAFGGAAISPQLPRFEVWPHQQSAYVIPFMYEKRFPDLNDSNGELPRYTPGNVLLEGGLAACARWPGPDTEHRNPYFGLTLATMHQERYDKQVRELERQDDEIYGRDVNYGIQDLPFCPYPFPVNASYLQLHAI